MTYLLSADIHLDDQSGNEYRWQWFDRVRDIKSQHRDISQVFILGDLVDRKDRHSAAFVNRLLDEIERSPLMTILMGNHDRTMRPPAYFEFLPNYVFEPTEFAEDLLLLPFTAHPAEDWSKLRLGDYRAVFMHATVTGAKIDRGIVLENPGFPVLPQHVKFYSGDIHHPQTVGNVTYVGAPHPVKYGDDYDCRMLLIDDVTYDIVEEIALSPPRKLLLDIHNAADLAKLKVRAGDQVRLRINCEPDAIGELGQIQARIARWAKTVGVAALGVEVIVDAPLSSGLDTSQTPEAILRQFAEHEKLTDDVLAVGLELLKEVGNG